MHQLRFNEGRLVRVVWSYRRDGTGRWTGVQSGRGMEVQFVRCDRRFGGLRRMKGRYIPGPLYGVSFSYIFTNSKLTGTRVARIRTGTRVEKDSLGPRTQGQGLTVLVA